ncbi:MAG: Na+/H+ antiporter subunit C [Cyclobacteriaceae bacterium]|nr:Na+/H+ antiporter subunit C [Cyclobacteriaceae bacterium]
MEIILAITIGMLYSAGIYLLLRRSVTKLILGIILLSNATNLLVFISGGLTTGNPPFIPVNEELPPSGIADPLPQALVLTALVIGLGIIAYTMVLKYKYHDETGNEDFDNAKETDR